MKVRLLGAVCATVFSVITLPSQAALIGVLPETPGGTDWQAYYDDVANLTWTADANINGGMNWDDANAWAATLDIVGVSGWRLPKTPQPDPSCTNSGGSTPSFNCTGSEMGNLYYNVLGNAEFGPLTNTSPFSNLQPRTYWSSLEYAPDPTQAWFFSFSSGRQVHDNKDAGFNAWAVQSGDVGAVPIPAALWLFGSGLLGLIRVARKKAA